MRIPLTTAVLLLAFFDLTRSSELPSLPSPQATEPIPATPKNLVSYNSALPIINDQTTNGANSSFLDPEDKRGGGGSSGGGGHGGGGGGHGGGEGSSGSKGGGTTAVGGTGADSGHGSSVVAHSMAPPRELALLGLYVFWIGKGVARLIF